MKNTLLFSTLVIGLALTGCNKSTRTSTASTSPTYPSDTAPATATTPSTTASTDTLGAKVDRATDRMADATRNAANKVSDAARDVGHDISAKVTEWRLNASDIEADVVAGRPVVRTNNSAGAPTGKIDKGNLEKTIKGKIAADAKTADLRLDVNANAKGEVELEGKARSAEEIAAAMACALDTEGVTQVTSKIKIDPKAGRNH